MLRVLVLATALAACAISPSACAPTLRVVEPSRRTPDWALEGDFALVCVAGATAAATYNTGSAAFLPSLAAFVGLIALDTWAAR